MHAPAVPGLLLAQPEDAHDPSTVLDGTVDIPAATVPTTIPAPAEPSSPTGALAGPVLAVAVLLAAVLLGCALLWRRRRRSLRGAGSWTTGVRPARLDGLQPTDRAASTQPTDAARTAAAAGARPAEGELDDVAWRGEGRVTVQARFPAERGVPFRHALLSEWTFGRGRVQSKLAPTGYIRIADKIVVPARLDAADAVLHPGTQMQMLNDEEVRRGTP